MTKKKPYGYWKKEENVLVEALNAMIKYGWSRLPPESELRKHGYNPLSLAINRYHGGIRNIRNKLGQTNTTKPKGYWQKEENVLVEAQQAMKEQGWSTLPSDTELEKHGYAPLTSAMSRHHGGIQNIRNKLGQTNTIKPNGYWKSLENTLAEARQAMEKEVWDTLPSAEVMKKHGYHGLNHAITSYYGGFLEFRKKLGQQNNKKPNGYWQKEENVLSEVRKAMLKHQWDRLPSQQDLAKHGYNSLSLAMIKYHGGIQNIRNKLGQTNTTKPNGYWQKLENVIKEAQQAMKEQDWDTLPTQREMSIQGYDSLNNALIRYHGGLIAFRKLLAEHITGKTQKQQLEELLDEYIAA